MTEFGTVVGFGAPTPGAISSPIVTGTDPDGVANAVNSGQVGDDTPGLQVFSDAWGVLVDFVGRYIPERSAGFANVAAAGGTALLAN